MTCITKKESVKWIFLYLLIIILQIELL
jgi:hypothetical protein